MKKELTSCIDLVLGEPLPYFFTAQVADLTRGGLEALPAGANKRERRALVAGSDGVVLMMNYLLDSKVITRFPDENFEVTSGPDECLSL